MVLRDGLDKIGYLPVGSGRLDLHSIGLVSHPTGDPVLIGELIDVRAKPHALHNSLNAHLDPAFHCLGAAPRGFTWLSSQASQASSPSPVRQETSNIC